MKLKLYVFMVMCFATIGLAIGQSTVKGVVVDASSGETLPGASISVNNGKYGTISNMDGSFDLKLSEGEYILDISFVGYISQEQNLSVNASVIDLGTIELKSSTVGLKEVYISASFVTDRKTPVSVSTIEPVMIAEKLGSQEFPEILKTTPSVYVTKDGGGFGDASVRVRGFDTYNVGVLINGIPVNGMEDSKVYWSNWAGLSDVTQTMQVQRGLGASKLGLSSVGGTINIITRSTDAEKGGTAYVGMGNDGYRKQSFSVSSGLTEKGWAFTLLGTHTYGDGYINGLAFDGYSYFANISKKINDAHMLSFTLFGAPQTHNQHGYRHYISWYQEQDAGIRANANYGMREGEAYGGGYGYNYYHKPQASLNHYWNINEKTLLTNVLYASKGTGGGRRVDGDNSGWLGIGYYTGEDDPTIKRTAEGLLDFDAVAQENQQSIDGSKCFIGNSVNNHTWYGVLSTLTTNWLNVDWTLGFDGRYYKGEHYREVEDLLGADFMISDWNVNHAEGTKYKVGDKYSYYNDGEVLWGGLFAQGEYVVDHFSGFLSVAVSNKSYRRTDYYHYTPGNQVSEWVNYLPWNVKGGASYSLDSHHTFFANAGYVKREPIFSNVFLNYYNDVIPDSKFETVITGEAGYSYSSRRFNAKASFYYTNWLDKALVKSLAQEGSVFIPGINALHKGVELEATYKPTNRLTLKGMFSLGDWVWQDDVHFVRYDEEQNVVDSYDAYIAGVHVGNSAQSMSSVSLSYELLPGLRLGADYVYLAKNYSNFDVTNRTSLDDKVDAWQMPDVGLVDMSMSYKFEIGSLNASLYANVNNLLNTEYVSDATDGTDHDQYSALVYYGFGRTWNTGLKIQF